MDCSLQDSPVYGILQERILEWVAISSSRRASWRRNWTWVSGVSCIGRRILYHEYHLGSTIEWNNCSKSIWEQGSQLFPLKPTWKKTIEIRDYWSEEFTLKAERNSGVKWKLLHPNVCVEGLWPPSRAQYGSSENRLGAACFSSSFSSVMSNSLQPHGLQHARPPCPLQLQEPTQTHVHRVGDAIQPSHSLYFILSSSFLC